MQNVSSAFHEAVLANAPQSAYLRFADDIFTNEDIDISGGGLNWTQPLCSQTDLKIGATMSATLNCDLLNENRVLRDYRFGEFHAWLGVRIADIETGFTGLATGGEGVTVKSVTLGTDPNWILVDNTALGDQPGFEPASMAVDGTVLYVISAEGDVWAYDLEEDEELEPDLTPHMEAKALSFAQRGLFVSCWEYEGYAITHQWTAKSGRRQVFEYCRLGVFNAERPAKLADASVSLSGYDRMALFEKYMGSDITIGSGMTFGAMLQYMCNVVGVPLATATFPNSALIYKKASKAFNSKNFREIVGYIAEAAGRIARMTRDGKLELVWLNTTNLRLTGDKYSAATIYSYQVKPIGKTAVYPDRGGVIESDGTE